MSHNTFMKSHVRARNTSARIFAVALAACAAGVFLGTPPASAAQAARGLQLRAAVATDTISVTVSGAVATPGPRKLPQGARLNDALKAASPSLDADLRAVLVSQGAGSGDLVNYLKFLSDKSEEGNPILHDGDVITVRRQAATSISVSVRGQVVSPGWTTLPSGATYNDAIKAAGGFAPDADRGGISIQHANEVTQHPVDTAVAEAKPGDAASNPVLNDGDVIIVRSVARPNVYTIGGAVLHPGEYPLPSQPITLADAIGKAGGTAERAKLNDTSIIRSAPGGKVASIKVKAGDPTVQGTTIVQAGDNIMIPQGSPGQRVDPFQVIGIVISLVAVFGHR